MPVGKRATKVVSYNEQDDDDDFLPSVDKSKKNRHSMKSDDISTDLKSNKKQVPRKSDEKLSKCENEESKTVVELSKTSPVIVSLEIPFNRDEIENAKSQSIVSSQESKTSSQQLTDVDDKEEDLSPKSKRRKHEEVEDIHEDESEHEDEEDSTSAHTITSTTEEKLKKTEILSNHDNTSRFDHRDFPTRTSDPPKKRASVPFGFPTSKINIPSPNVFRVGLSRKSATIKPLHPNLASRVVHE